MASIIKYRKDTDKYYLRFNNPIDKKDNLKQITSSNLDLLIDKAAEKDLAFYSENPFLVPDGITLDTTSGRFRVYTRYGYIGKASYTLREAMSIRLDALQDLTSTKYDHKKGEIKLVYKD